jgi:protein CLEC16A
LQQALVGESSGEEQLFSSESGSMRNGIEFGSELDGCLQKLKVVMLSSLCLSLCLSLSLSLSLSFLAFYSA